MGINFLGSNSRILTLNCSLRELEPWPNSEYGDFQINTCGSNKDKAPIPRARVRKSWLTALTLKGRLNSATCRGRKRGHNKDDGWCKRICQMGNRIVFCWVSCRYTPCFGGLRTELWRVLAHAHDAASSRSWIQFQLRLWIRLHCICSGNALTHLRLDDHLQWGLSAEAREPYRIFLTLIEIYIYFMNQEWLIIACKPNMAFKTP